MQSLTFNGAALVTVARERSVSKGRTREKEAIVYIPVPVRNFVARSFESCHPPIFVAWRPTSFPAW